MDVISAFEAHRDADIPLVLDPPGGQGRGEAGRPIAELYRVESGGLLMLDVGWAYPALSYFPEHLLPDITGDGPWHGGGFTIREAVPAIEDSLIQDWKIWRAVRLGLGATREAGRKYGTGAFPGITLSPANA